MKHINITYLLVATVLSAGLMVTSCGKTTKGKIDKDWKVTNYEETTARIDQTMTQTEFIKLDQSEAAITYNQLPTGQPTVVTTSQGKTLQNTFTIRKDGTWNLIREYYTEHTYQDTLRRFTRYYSASGSWNFLEKGKEDGYGKRERILFQTLQEKVSNVLTFIMEGQPDNVVTSDVTNNTYELGDFSTIYVVEDSSRKKLSLTSESIVKTDNNFSGTYTTEKSIKMDLE